MKFLQLHIIWSIVLVCFLLFLNSPVNDSPHHDSFHSQGRILSWLWREELPVSRLWALKHSENMSNFCSQPNAAVSLSSPLRVNRAGSCCRKCTFRAVATCHYPCKVLAGFACLSPLTCAAWLAHNTVAQDGVHLRVVISRSQRFRLTWMINESSDFGRGDF